VRRRIWAIPAALRREFYALRAEVGRGEAWPETAISQTLLHWHCIFLLTLVPIALIRETAAGQEATPQEA
jgi:hypothetical protein